MTSSLARSAMTWGGNGVTTAVDDLSITVQSNEVFGLLGPNGAGKTTTVECIEGLRTPDRFRAAPDRRARRMRDVLAGAIAGLAVLVSVWGFLSQPAHTSVSAEEIALTPEAHGGDTVTVIVADFRGLDTLVEVTVLLAAVIGVAALLRRGKLW